MTKLAASLGGTCVGLAIMTSLTGEQYGPSDFLILAGIAFGVSIISSIAMPVRS